MALEYYGTAQQRSCTTDGWKAAAAGDCRLQDEQVIVTGIQDDSYRWGPATDTVSAMGIASGQERAESSRYEYS